MLNIDENIWKQKNFLKFKHLHQEAKQAFSKLL